MKANNAKNVKSSALALFIVIKCKLLNSTFHQTPYHIFFPESGVVCPFSAEIVS
jgi:hypothetical protein